MLHLVQCACVLFSLHIIYHVGCLTHHPMRIVMSIIKFSSLFGYFSVSYRVTWYLQCNVALHGDS